MSAAPYLSMFLVALLSGLFFASGMVSAIAAHLKSYRPWFWLCSMGPVGLLIMVFKPALSQAKTPEERERWEQRADWTGGILSAITLMLMMIPVAGVFFFYARSSAAIPPAPVPRPRPPIVAVPPSANVEPISTPQSPAMTEDSPRSPSSETGEQQDK